MSVLFDRLCTLAAADEVLVLLALDVVDADGPHDFDLADLLARTARVPGLDVWLVGPPRQRPHDASDRWHAAVAAPACHRSVDDALAALASGDVRSVRVSERGVCVRDDVPTLDGDRRPARPLLFVAADRPGWSESLAAAAERGVACSVGGIDPAANFHLSSVDGVLAALDALVDLRRAASRPSTSAAG